MPLADDVGLNTLTGQIIHGAMEVHKHLGPGLLESVYRVCLTYELRESGMAVVTEVRVPVRYKRVTLDCGYKIDLLVESTVIVEVKAQEAIAPVHKAQLLTYLKLTTHKVGLILNFNAPLMKDGIQRVLNNRGERTVGNSGAVSSWNQEY
jgi:GxxExxY protein